MRQPFPITPFLEPGSTLLSIKRIAGCLRVDPLELVTNAGVDRDAIDEPGSLAVQARLRDIFKVLAAATEAFEHHAQVVPWMMNMPITTFRGKTAYQLIKEGRSNDVIGYLDSVASGFVG